MGVGPMTRKLPSKIRLGGGWVVSVRVVPQETIRNLTNDPRALACSDYSVPDRTAVISVGDDRTPRQQWADYWHELGHTIWEIAEAEHRG